MNYWDKLEARIKAVDSNLCVGIDPKFSSASSHDTVYKYCVTVVSATSDFAAAYKINTAFFDQHKDKYGRITENALIQIMSLIPPEIPIIGDIKRSDIPETMEAHARAAFTPINVGAQYFFNCPWMRTERVFDAVTLLPNYGPESIAPFQKYTDKGIYIVTLPTTPEGLSFANLHVREILEQFANCGYVVGADVITREFLRIQIENGNPNFSNLLIPGCGRQGGKISDWINHPNFEKKNNLFSVSRSIMYPDGQEANFGDIRRAAAKFYGDQFK